MNPDAYPELRAEAPKPDAESLRSAYLDVLALTLCDLTGQGTLGVHRRLGGGVFSREVICDETDERIAGSDWPQHGLSMAGPVRLRELRACLEAVVAENVPGDVIEAGCWRGGAGILMRATLDTLDATDRTLVVADSFNGYPLPLRERFPQDRDLEERSMLDYFAVPQADVEGNFQRFGLSAGVEFVPGFFDETLRRLADRTFALVHVDAGSYEGTAFALDALYPALAPGGLIVVGEYRSNEQVRLAVDEFRAEHGISEPLEGGGESAARWRRPAGESLTIAPREPRHRTPSDRGAARLPHSRVPGVREIEIDYENAVLRWRLATAAAEIKALRSGADPATVVPTELLPPEDELRRAKEALPLAPTDEEMEGLKDEIDRRLERAQAQQPEKI